MSDVRELSMQRVACAIQAFKNGQMVIMTDDESRENEGDLVIPATDASPEAVNFMATHGRGLICLAISGDIVDRLELGMMLDRGKDGAPLQTAFTVSIEAREGVTTGISAQDRSHTIQKVMEDQSSPKDFVVPGHVFPLRARKGGVLERAGHTEGAVDLAKLSGKKPGGVICEIMSPDGTMARRPELEEFGSKHGIPIVSIEDLIHYRLNGENLISCKSTHSVVSCGRDVYQHHFESQIDGAMHLVWTNFDVNISDVVMADVRVHKQMPLSDVLAASKGALGDSVALSYGFELLQQPEPAALIYLMQNNYSASLEAEVQGLPLKDDPKMYGIGAQMLRQLGLNKMRLHVRKKPNLVGLQGFGLEIIDFILMEN